MILNTTTAFRRLTIILGVCFALCMPSQAQNTSSAVGGFTSKANAQSTSSKSSPLSAAFQNMEVQLEAWLIDIDFRPNGTERDGDSEMYGPRIRVDLPSDYRLDARYLRGREDYGSDHTDVDHGRAALLRDYNGVSIGAGYSYWNNDYSVGGSVEEHGPTLHATAETDDLCDCGNISAQTGLTWQFVDLGDEGDYEYLELEASVGAKLPISESLGDATLQIGYRHKDYYDSPDDYGYSGPIARLGWRF